MPTIFALSTSYHKSAIAVIRVSGNHATDSMNLITNKNIIPYKPTLTFIYNYNKQVIDEGIVTYFKAPKSYTGQDMVEYYIHGSLGVIKELIHTLSTQKNHRLALPGEFTKLALLNNKINLLKAESIADLINAKTISQINQSMFHINNSALKIYNNYQDQIKNLMALVETTIDFSDQDIPHDLEEQIQLKITELLKEISTEKTKSYGAKKINEGIKITILGKPNVGKSSLLNLITQKDTAIISNIAGTTRDVIEVDLDFFGYQITIADTAGIRKTKNPIEKQGVKKAIQKIDTSDLKISIFDISNINNQDTEIFQYLDKSTLIILNKQDLNTTYNIQQFIQILNKHKAIFNIKNIVLTSLNNNTEPLLKTIKEHIANLHGNIENPIIINERHLHTITNVEKNLQLALNTTHDVVLCSFNLKQALNSLNMLMGKTNTEEILDIIFSKFCIGK